LIDRELNHPDEAVRAESAEQVDLLTPMRAGASLDELRKLLLDGVWEKPWGHGLADNVIPLNRIMSEIGG